MAVDGLRGAGYAHKEYEPWDIQDLQHWQDKTNETVMVLEANTKILRALRRFYSDLTARKDFPQALRDLCEDDLDTFFSQLDEITSDFDIQISRAKLLVNIISDRKELVLQHLQSQASERTEQLNKNLEREAIVMRIITIVTLLYLPATFVSVCCSELCAACLLIVTRRSSALMLSNIRIKIKAPVNTRTAPFLRSP
jgi:hypothetical protein